MEKGNSKQDNNISNHLDKYIAANDFKQGESFDNNDTNGDAFDTSNIRDLDYISISTEELPCADFYQKGTQVLIRAARVDEIQSYSMMDETIHYDIFIKVTELIERCVLIRLPDGTKKPYTHIFDVDRWYLLFAIRELTFPNSNDLVSKINDNISIPIKRNTFKFHKITSDKIRKYYDEDLRMFVFKPKGMVEVKIAPPTIGIQKAFTEYVINQHKKKKTPNLSFVKVVPFLLPHRTYITQEGLEKWLNTFTEMDKPLFNFINDIVDNHMKFGISGVYLKDESGEEVHSDDIFPDGIKSLFVGTNVAESMLD